MNTNDHDLEKDPVWNLVDQAPPVEASPLFSRNVMRQLRLEDHRPTAWWRTLLSPKPLAAGALAIAAAVAIMVSLNDSGSHTDPGLAGSVAEDPSIAYFHQQLEQELLMAVAEDPSLFSDEQVLALLY